MPYATNAELPVSIRSHLPGHAQDIYRAAFNNAWERYDTTSRREEIAHRIAWSAVKKVYRKADGLWVRKDTVN